MRNAVLAASLGILSAFASSVNAAVVFDSGPINGKVNANELDSSYRVTNPFTSTGDYNLTGAIAGLWTTSTPTTVAWSIGTTPFGSQVGFGLSALTNTVLTPASSYGYGTYKVYSSSFAINGNVIAGSYYLSLDSAQSANGARVYWDMNNPALIAYKESFGYFPGNAFQILGGAESTAVTPEPASLALWGLGSLCCMVYGYRKRKLAVA